MKRDILVAAVVFAAVAAYIGAYPRSLNGGDEAAYLHEAKRLYEGERLYRDVFELTTPGWLYLVAGLYAIFGVTIGVPKVATAMLHGATAAGVLLACRAAGVRRSLALLAAIAYVVLSPPAWPVASQHWLATCLSVALLTASLAVRRRAAFALLPGVLAGLLIAVHQRGAVLAGAVGLWLVVEALRARGTSPSPVTGGGERGTWTTVMAYMGGLALVVLPLGVWLVANAGKDAVWEALVLFPLTSYREKFHSSWGNVALLLAPYAKHTFPRVLAVLPLVLIPTAGRAVLAARRRGGPEVTRLGLLSLAGAGAVASILYYPDFVHLAFVAPLLLVAAAEHLEAAVQQVRITARVAWIGGGLVPALALIAVAPWLRSNLLATRAIYPVSEDTAFGRVDMASDVVVSVYRTVERLVREVPDRALFSYPTGSDLYLLTGARNPTRYEFFMGGYNTREQVDEVIRALEVRRVPYVVVNPLLARPGDPIGAFIREHYTPLDDGTIAGKLVFRLK